MRPRCCLLLCRCDDWIADAAVQPPAVSNKPKPSPSTRTPAPLYLRHQLLSVCDQVRLAQERCGPVGRWRVAHCICYVGRFHWHRLCARLGRGCHLQEQSTRLARCRGSAHRRRRPRLRLRRRLLCCRGGADSVHASQGVEGETGGADVQQARAHSLPRRGPRLAHCCHVCARRALRPRRLRPREVLCSRRPRPRSRSLPPPQARRHVPDAGCGLCRLVSAAKRAPLQPG